MHQLLLVLRQHGTPGMRSFNQTFTVTHKKKQTFRSIAAVFSGGYRTSPNYSKSVFWNNVCDCLLAMQLTKPFFSKWVCSKKNEFAPLGFKSFHFRGDPFSEGRQNFDSHPLKLYHFPLNYKKNTYVKYNIPGLCILHIRHI